MLGWGANPFQNALSPLLNDPQTPVETVMMKQQFANLFAQESSDVVEFLFRDANVERLLEYALTDNMKNEPNARKLAQMSVAILSGTNKPKLQARIARSGLLLSKVTGMLTGEFPENVVICGYFGQIVEGLVRSTDGEVLGGELNELAPFLIAHIRKMGLRELLYKLIVDYTVPFQVSSRIMYMLVDHMVDDTDTLCLLFLIRDVILAKPDLMALMTGERFLATLFEVGIANYCERPLASREVFHIIASIIAYGPGLKDYHMKYKDRFKYYETINCATAAVLTVFPEDVRVFLPPLFKLELSTILSDVIGSILSRSTTEEMMTLAEQTHVCQIAMDNFAEYQRRKIDGHFLDLIRRFSDRGICCCDEHRKRWTRFAKHDLTTQYRKVMSGYGGDTCADAAELQKNLFASMDDLYSALADADGSVDT